MPPTVLDLSKVASFPVRLTSASESYPGRIVFQVVGAGSFSVTPQAQLQGTSSTGANLVNVPYTNRGTGAPVGAGTAITAAGLFEVDATGVEIWLSGSYTSGAGTVALRPLAG